MLASAAALEAVTMGAEGVPSEARPGTVLGDMSMVSVDASRRVADPAHAAGVGASCVSPQRESLVVGPGT